METWHRVTFRQRDHVEGVIESLKVKHKKGPLPGGHYLIYVDITESDPRWPELSALIKEKDAHDMYNTMFSEQEILQAEWVRLMPVFEQGYPQPKTGWEDVSIENECLKCGVGFRQKAPFRLAKEPRMGKHDFLSLYWTYTLFCTPRVIEALQAHQIRGYEVWDAIMHRTNQPSQIVSQLIFPHIAEPGLADEDKLMPETCPQCGVTKYGYHKRGYMHIRREALRSDVDVQLTGEWIGSGRYGGFREILISNRLARLIFEQGWRGVRLKPIELI